MDSSIKHFWQDKFSGLVQAASMKPYPGWKNDCEHDESYVPAKLTLRDDFNDLTQNVWLIGAPGAVGKSTLAKEICAATGAVYLDLAEAATVAGNYMVGGLVYTNLLESWTAGRAAVLIDALDEARLRVTQSGFEAFLSDVAAVARMGKFPVVLLGRVGIIEEAWTIFNERENLELPIFDIELFEPDEAKRFVLARLFKLSKAFHATTRRPEHPDLARALELHRTVYEDAIDKVVVGLQELSAHDANRFVGYAPVLDAVAKVIASESNPARINDEMRRVLEGEVLLSLSNEILAREATKLVAQVNSSLPGLPAGLYEPEEQLERLACRLFKLSQPPMPSQLTQQQVAAYEQAVQNLLPQHPFLDGTGTAPSSAVFAASTVAAALQSHRGDIVKGAERYANFAQHTPNPFLFDFYREAIKATAEIPTEHIGLVFESVLAKSKPGDTVRLSVEGADGGALDVEIMIIRPDEQANRLEFTAPCTGTIRLGRRVAGVSIDAEDTIVELGIGDQLELVAPISINARTLKLSCNQVVVKAEPKAEPLAVEGGAVTLEAAELIADPAIAAPTVRVGAQLQVAWPDSTSYPWSTFAAPSIQDEDPRTMEALRILRRLTMAFRSHSKGQLARFKGKIEHVRMLKGSVGRALLDKLLRDGVVRLNGPMYYLEPDALGSKVGASFLEIKLKTYSSRTREYVQQLGI
ncbi:MAG: hypothetical protein ROZ00_00430 [Denitratisoma sp.]|nr:hypothetical protein [Denitratisoma sp.]